ncbi:MAG: ribosome biogenesis GTPase Der [Flavobacteriaceae bacterium]|tara:strand:+ start:16439 stop:17743 length:1305 start_codon:yes stop_codon:yes gene_type:complete
MNSIVAIVGRPNVGKSTLFNRLVKQKKAITDPESGVTRDRHYGKAEWNGKQFSVIDTGGYIVGGDDVFEREIDYQVELAIEESDLIIFLVDIQTGITEEDLKINKLLKKSKKKVFLLVNKVDNSSFQGLEAEFFKLGFKDIYSISANNGLGSGDFMDALAKNLANIKDEIIEELPQFAVVGRPNAGKSSFINSIIDNQRHIVSEIPGTTRDSTDSYVNKFGFNFNLIDTAGIRRKKKVKEDLEFFSVLRAVRSIERSNVVLLLVDATRDFDTQVQKIFWLAHRNNKGIVILINKWDLIEKDILDVKKYEKKIKDKIVPFKDVPILFISVIKKQRVLKSLEIAIKVFESRNFRISTSELNKFILPIVQNNPPPSNKGKIIKIKFCTQLPTKHPQFVLFCNLPQYIKESYKRFIENKLRGNYNFSGVPINIYFRKK